jgi:hypothetical protein
MEIQHFLRGTIMNSLDTRQTAMTSAGTIELPIAYRDGSAFGCFYRVNLQLAAGLIPTHNLEPIPFGDKAIAAIFGFEYRDTSIGPYGELAISILARSTGTRDSAFRAVCLPASAMHSAWHVVNLPVTTEVARAGGVDIWGFPKYICPIGTEFRNHGLRIVLEGELEIQHKNGFGLRLPARPVAMVTILNKALLRTVVRGQYGLKYGGASSVQVKVLGDGPTARTVKKLGLDSMSPFVAFRTDHLNMLLPEGTPVGTI